MKIKVVSTPLAFVVAMLVAFLSGGTSLLAQTERMPSEKLLPETTVAYVQIANFREFVQKSQDSNFGRMLADEKIAPLVEDLYGQAKDAFEDFKEQIGLEWDDLEQLPHGEICFAVIAHEGLMLNSQ
ncbi:MAG: hypothetical protein R3C03_20610 [Pirellulaceae bacterium]